MSGLSARTVIRLAAGIALVAGLAGCGHTAPDPGVTPEQSSSQPRSAAPEVFDLGRDFSLAANPNGPWRYGYTSGTQVTVSALVPSTVADQTTPVGLWHPGPGPDGYYPYVGGRPSPSPTTVHDATDSWALRPGEVALEAGPSGQLAAIWFTVPRTGSYTIAADFAGVHKRLSSTDAHVVLNDESLFTATISGYGGDPSYFAQQGSSPTASYHATRDLRAGDILIFAIGFGPNHTHQNDTSGLIATISTTA